MWRIGFKGLNVSWLDVGGDGVDLGIKMRKTKKVKRRR